MVWNGPGAAESLDGAVRVLSPGQNLGFAGGANHGIRAALAAGVGQVLLLNNDALPEPDAPALLLAALERDPRVALAGPRILDLEGSDIWHDGGHIDWPSGRPCSHEGDRGDDRSAGGGGAAPREVGFVCGCAPLVRGRAFEEVGGFDERYFLTFEDADLSLRLRRRGWRLQHVPAARVRHGGSTSLVTRSPRDRYYRLRNRLLFATEHAPDPGPTRRALRWLRARSRWQALRWLVSGRAAEARAVLAALGDARRGRYGRWPGG